MNRRISFALFLIAMILFSSLLYCTMGGSTEQGNARICGSLYPCNLPETNIIVHLVPAQYNPYDSSTGRVYKTIADIYGNFSFENVSYGLYYLYAFDNDKSNTLLKGPVTIAFDQNELEKDSLRRSSSVRVNLNSSEMISSGFFFIKGASSININQQDTVIELENVPSGKQDIVHYDSSADIARDFALDVEILPEESITVSYNNRPPRIITSTADLPTKLRIDTTYNIQLKISDSDSDSVSISALTQGMVNFSLDSHSAIIKWSPVFSDLNLKSITFKVVDQRGASSTFTWNFSIREVALPVPEQLTGTTECIVDSLYVYTADTMSFQSLPLMYRFTIDGGDPTPWSQQRSYTQNWTETGLHKIQVQIGYNSGESVSEWSEVLSVMVRKISRIPVMLSTKDSVAYGSTYIPQVSSECSLIRFHLSDSTSQWTDAKTLNFSPQRFGIIPLQISSWCDTAYSLPSEKSALCTLIVYPPDPILKIQTGYVYSDNVTLPFSLHISNKSIGQTDMHISIYSKQFPEEYENLGYITIDSVECINEGLKCTDTLKFINGTESSLFVANNYTLHLLAPKGDYQINVRYIITPDKIVSRWVTLTLVQN